MEIRDTKIQKKNAETKKTKGKKNEKKKNGTHRRSKPEETNSVEKSEKCKRVAVGALRQSWVNTLVIDKSFQFPGCF